MEIEIYKKGENNPMIIHNWSEFFTYFTEIPENAEETLEFWDPVYNEQLNTKAVIENLKQIVNTNKILEYLNTKEF